ncbi:MAG: PEGA domain-containing protein [Vicinamibacterales bacterium]|nr:PEGA domain-containing protein [Vicinamibacterales bacterium]
MSAATHLTFSSTGFRDGLGERSLVFDRQHVRTLEALHLRPELGAFGPALEARVNALSTFRHRSFARIREVTGPPGRLVLISDHVPGTRLSELFDRADDRQAVLDADSALYLTKRLLAGVDAFRQATGFTHGALSPDRIIVTRRARVIVTEHALTPALERLRFSTARWWRDARIAMPVSRRDPAFDERTDIAQLAIISLGLLRGRLLGGDEGPEEFEVVLGAAELRTGLGTTRPLPASLHAWFARALSLRSSRGFASLSEARVSFDLILTEDFPAGASRVSFRRFLGRIGDDDSGAELSQTDIGTSDELVAPVEPAPPPQPPVARPATPLATLRPQAVAAPDPGQPEPEIAPMAAPLASSPGYEGPDELALGGVHDALRADWADWADDDSVPRPSARPRWGRGRIAALFVLSVGLAAAALTGPFERLADAGARNAEVPLEAPVPVAEVGQLEVTSTPSGARVTIDGARVGRTPITVDDLSIGAHVVRFESPQGTIERTVEVMAGQTAVLSEAIYAGWVALFAPVQLDVQLDGRHLGTTEDGRLMVPPGSYTFEVVNERLGVRQRHVLDVEPGAVVARTIDLPPGELTLRAEPWAEVSIDGAPIGRTPLDAVPVAVGTRQILFSHPEFGEKRAVLTVGVTPPIDLHMDMTR